MTNSFPPPLSPQRDSSTTEMGMRWAQLPLPTPLPWEGGHRVSPVKESHQDASPEGPGPGCRGFVSGQGGRGPWALIPTQLSSPSRSSVSAWQTESLWAPVPSSQPGALLMPFRVSQKSGTLAWPQLKSRGVDILPSRRGRPLKQMAPNEPTSLGRKYGKV